MRFSLLDPGCGLQEGILDPYHKREELMGADQVREGLKGLSQLFDLSLIACDDRNDRYPRLYGVEISTFRRHSLAVSLGGLSS